jgi:hypothetical protein
MHRLPLSTRHALLYGLLCVVPACSAAPETEPGEAPTSDDSALYGGFPAKSKKLDAVGSIVELISDKDGGVYLQKCTGTLIGPHTVLTAAHCVQKYKGKESVDYTELRFRIGYDSTAPTQELPIVGGYVGPIYDGGLTGRGADVGLLFLAEDISDVAPIPPDTVPLGEDSLDKSFAIVGFGQEDPLDPVGAHRDRQMGTLRLEALQGDPKKVLWSSPEDMAAWLSANAEIDIPASSLGGFWDAPQHVLIAGQVGFFSSIHNGTQAGRGDSGGPILRLGGGGQGLRVVATVGGSWAINFSNGTQVLFGGTYGGLVASPENADFISTKSSEHCRGVPVGGYCNGDIAVQCNEEGQFTQAITTFDCRELGLWCGSPDGEVGCIDPEPQGNGTSCALVGKYKDPNNVAYEFKADGTYTIRDVPRGHYLFDAGLLQVDDDVGLCHES